MLKKIKQTAKKTITGLALIAALAQPAAAQNNVELSGSAGIRLASNHIVDSGTEIGEGPVMQNHISATVKYKGFGLTGLIWDDFSLKTKTNDERDFWLMAGIPTPLSQYGIDLSARYKRFMFPSHPEWGQDNILGGVVSYSGPINVMLEWNHLFPQGNTEEGDRYYLVLSKEFELHESDDLNVTLKDSLSTSYDDGFYGRFGHMHVTLGGEVIIDFPSLDHFPPCTVKLDLKAQKGIGDQASGEPVEDLIYGGISAGVNF